MNKRKARKRKVGRKRRRQVKKRILEGSEQIAIKAAKEFGALDADVKDRYVDATLQAIAKYIGNPKLKTKIFRYIKNPKGAKPETVETIVQLISCFLWSVKPQYRWVWARILYHFIPLQASQRQRYIQDALRKEEEYRQMGLKFFYFAIPPDGREKMEQMLKELNLPSLEAIDDMIIVR